MHADDIMSLVDTETRRLLKYHNNSKILEQHSLDTAAVVGSGSGTVLILS